MHQGRVAHGARYIGTAPPLTGHPDHVDDHAVAALAHLRIEVADQAHGAEHLELPAVLDVVVAKLGQIAAGYGAGVVDEDIRITCRFGQGLHRFRRRQVQRVHGGLCTEACVQVVAYGIQVGLGARDQVHRGTFFGQNFGDGLADALAGAGDDGGLAAEL